LDNVAPRALFRDNLKWPPDYLNVRLEHRRFAFATADPRVWPQAATAATIMPSTDHFLFASFVIIRAEENYDKFMSREGG
jgi:hypothetical protein